MTKTLYIDPELQAWIDPLSPAELAGLEASLLEEGCRDPLVVWSDGCLLDGHNRYALCMKHGLPFTTVEKTGLTTKDDVKIWMVENQSGRRNLSIFARVAYALKIKPLLEARAKARMVAGKADPRLNSDEGPVRTDESIAKAAGVGRDTVRKVEMIIEKADAEVIDKVRTGELSIHKAAEMVVQPKPPKSKVETEDIKPKQKVATLRLPLEPGDVVVANVDEMVAEIAALREQLADRNADLAETLAENEQMARVFEANDQIKASMAEVARFKALSENAERTLAARSQEFNERARNVLYWKNRAEKAEKLLSKAEASNDQGALRAENARLRADIGDLHAERRERNAQLDALTSEKAALAAQLGNLAEMLEEAMKCHDEMRKILEANVPLPETPRVLHQALALALTMESRVAEAVHCHADAQGAQNGFTQSSEDQAVVHGEYFTRLTGTDPFECQPSADDDMVQAVAEREPGVELDAAEMPENE